jgi:hypothetical protein
MERARVAEENEKESTMNAREQGKLGELFEFISNEGVRWLFVALPDAQWAITRNGERVVAGTGERRSLEAAVDKFMALTHAADGVTACDPVIETHLNRIQRDMRRSGDSKCALGIGMPAVARSGGTYGKLLRSFAKRQTGGLK